MKLEKAIEILEDLLGEGPQWPPDDRRDAVKMGIEALQRIERQRLDMFINEITLLPGETDG